MQYTCIFSYEYLFEAAKSNWAVKRFGESARWADLIWFKLNQLFSLLTGMTVLIQKLNSLPKKRSTPSYYNSHLYNLVILHISFYHFFQILYTFQYWSHHTSCSEGQQHECDNIPCWLFIAMATNFFLEMLAGVNQNNKAYNSQVTP